MLNTVTQQIHIQVSRHAKSGLLMATSEDLPRLMVAASDDDELRECVPLVIRDLFEADGRRVISVEASLGDDHLPPGFVSRNMTASAVLEAA